MKGISDVVSILLMVVITIGLIGLAYSYLSGVFTSFSASVLEFVSFSNGEIIVRNSGTQPIPVSSIKVFVSGSPEEKVRIKSDKDPIPPGQIATLTILDSYKFSGKKKITISGPANTLRIVGDFGINSPTGDSTWYARVGKHTGYGINYCGWSCENWANASIDNSWRWLPGLVAWYRFDEGYGNLAMDETLRNNGTLYNNPNWVDGKFGKALSFDGVDDYVKLSASASLDVRYSLTVAAWIKWLANADGPIFNWHHPGGTWGTHVWRVNGKLFTRVVKRDGTFTPPLSAGDIPVGDWIFITSTYDHNTGVVKHYINGNFVGQLNIGSVEQSTHGDAYIGSVPWDGRRVSGSIDEVMIFNRALSDEEIRLLYEQGTGKFESPVAFQLPCPPRIYKGYDVCCICEDPSRNCNGCEITVWFKKYITVPSNVKRVWMRFSTDDPIRIYVNGILAYERGCCCNPCQPIDLTPYILKGTLNTITAKFYEGCWCGYFGGTIWYDNLIENGGFEEGTWGDAGDCCCGECSCTSGASCTTIPGGKRCSCPNAPGGSCEFVSSLSTDAIEGKYSLNLTGRNACACNAKRILKFEVGKTYKLSFWYKHVRGPDCPRYCIWNEGRNVCDPAESLCDAASRDGNWHYYEKTFTVGEGTTGLVLYFYGGDGSDTEFSTNLYDDVRVVEVN